MSLLREVIRSSAIQPGHYDDPWPDEIPESLIAAAGDLVYGEADDQAAILPIGDADQVLTVVDGLPAWADAAGGSSFAHLIEDTGSTALITDWYLLAGALDGPAAILSGIEGEVGLQFWADYGVDGFPRLYINPTDGAALHAGDGTGATDTTFRHSDGYPGWTIPEVLTVGDDTFVGESVVIDGATGKVGSIGTAANTPIHEVSAIGDTEVRWRRRADGSEEWGAGAAAPFVSLQPNEDWGLQIAEAGFGLIAGNDAGNYAAMWDAAVEVSDGTSTMTMNAGLLRGNERADPAAPPANRGIIYFKDVGGKTALVARFPTGAVQQIAIEP